MDEDAAQQIADLSTPNRKPVSVRFRPQAMMSPNLGARDIRANWAGLAPEHGLEP
jgi:hypothetical protein